MFFSLFHFVNESSWAKFLDRSCTDQFVCNPYMSYNEKWTMSPQFVVCASMGLKMRIPQFSIFLINLHLGLRDISKNLHKLGDGVVHLWNSTMLCNIRAIRSAIPWSKFHFSNERLRCYTVEMRFGPLNYQTDGSEAAQYNTAQHYPHLGSWTLGWDYVESPLGSFWSLIHLMAVWERVMIFLLIGYRRTIRGVTWGFYFY